MVERLLQFGNQVLRGSDVGSRADQAEERSPGVPEGFHDEIEIMYRPLEDDANFGARSHSGAKDFLFDGRQTRTLFATDDFGVSFAIEVLTLPG
jgi:hypothetical protein